MEIVIKWITNMEPEKSRLLRMDNMGIVVETLDEVVYFLAEHGLKL
jgi:hypothetical protein